MAVSLVSRLIDFFKNKHIKIVLDICRIISAVSFAVSVFGLIFYTIGYSFLYGYYFSGDLPGYYSILNIIVHPVPINFYTVSIISSLIIIIVVFLISSIFVIKQKNWGKSVPILIFLVAFHICLSVFFVNGEDIYEKSFSFIVVWSVPVFITIMIFWMIRTPFHPRLSISGTLYGLFVFVIFDLILKIQDIYAQLFLPVGSFLLGIIFTLLNKKWTEKYIFRAFLTFPIVELIVLIFMYLLKIIIEVKIDGKDMTVLTCLAFLITLIISLKRYKESPEIPRVSSNSDNKKYTVLLNKLEQLGIPSIVSTVSIIILLLGILAPLLSLNAGQYIRVITTSSTREMQLIKNYDNSFSIKGNVVSIKEGNYYVSNEGWNLVIVKGDKIIVSDSN
ncbi:hypothetical protein FHS18_005069 [Paenibacillus phyllosphaerae]|uniref:Uncharacterized protein n=1 Tax=Paenibacillus phyllosphaerae TaxID=274593 RepID=A0A7W5B2D8_9BACL|nr:hypothetical protein [Paenibacillus phyllosphaerae]MBB3112967.1 hypothetical protein [Paenibacillus phyllosphaerae]